MKKNILVASGLLICGAVLIYSCQKEKPVTPSGGMPGNTIAMREGAPDPWTFGDMHNDVLNYVDQQVDGVPFETHEEANDAVALHMAARISSNYPDFDVDASAYTESILFKDAHFNFSNYYTVSCVTIAQEQLNELLSRELITPAENQILMDMFIALEAARTDGSGAIGAQAAIQTAHQQWDAQPFNVSEHEGFLSAAVISVATGSVALWQSHPEVLDPPAGSDVAAVPVWAAIDAVSAVVAGGSELIDQAGGSGDINWWAVGGKTVVGGVGGSVLGSKRALKYIAGWF